MKATICEYCKTDYSKTSPELAMYNRNETIMMACGKCAQKQIDSGRTQWIG